MRVIAGTLGGRRLRAPTGRGTRPTSDRVREALFSSLAADVVGARVLDVYAGSGALGIEALSRGAAAAVFVERDGSAARVLRGNLLALDLDDGSRTATLVTDVARLRAQPPSGRFDMVLADPPYGEPLADLLALLAALRDGGGLVAGARVVVERDRRAVDEIPGWLDLERRRTYGDTVLLFLRVESG